MFVDIRIRRTFDMSGGNISIAESELRRRIITPSQFVADPSAFIDVHLPRSSGKTSFSFIGAGVTQNDQAQTNLVEPHGFCVGAAGLKPGMINNFHLHYTAEVFVCVTGTWKMMIGLDKQQEVVIKPGDFFSVPTWVFRGFENIGTDDGFMFAFLGGDEPGGILWAPDVLDKSRETGFVLDESEKVTRLADLPPGAKTLRSLPSEIVSQVETYSDAEIDSRVVRFAGRDWQDHALLSAVVPGHGNRVAPVIGIGLNQHRRPNTAISYPHGFSVNWLSIDESASVGSHQLGAAAALLTMDSQIEIELGSDKPARMTVPPRSVVSLPANEWRDIRNIGSGPAEVVIAIGGEGRTLVQWSPEIIEAAAKQGFTVDAGGCMAPRALVDRYFG